MKKYNYYIIAASGKWNLDLFKNSNFSKNFFFVSNKSDLKKKINKLNPKTIFFIHWHYIIPKNIYSKFECVAFHMTDLPYGRGGSPLQNLIVRGHTLTKLSAFKVNNKIDAGPIYLKRSLKLSGSAYNIYKRLTLLAYQMINKIIKQNISPMEQKGKVTKFKRRNPKQSEIKNNNNIYKLYDFIRMLDAPGYPKAFLKNQYTYSFFDAKIKDNIINAKVIIKKND